MRPSAPASSTYDRSMISATAKKTAPRTMVCTAAPPRAGSMNCGRKARKNSETFGLSTLTSMPSAKARVSGAATGSAAAAASLTARSVRAPR